MNRSPRCEHGFDISMGLCVACHGEAARDLQKVKNPRTFRCRKCGEMRFRYELGEKLTCLPDFECE